MQGAGGKSKDDGEGEEEGEGEAEMELGGEEMESEEKTKIVKPNVPKFNYEVVGTMQCSWHKKTEDITKILEETQPDFTQEVLKCGFVVYDITKDENEIPKALVILTEMEKEVDKIKEMGPKTFRLYPNVRVFILISTVMTWALTKPIDKVVNKIIISWFIDLSIFLQEDPDVPFTENDYRKRKAHKNYLKHIACEKEVIQRGKKVK